jgi:hypothetical protein
MGIPSSGPKQFRDVTIEEFSGRLKQVVEAARQGFEPIKGEFDLLGAGNDKWKTTVWLPGSASCYLVKAEREVERTFVGLEYFFYHSDLWTVKSGSEADLLREYEKVVGFVGQTTGWNYEPSGNMPGGALRVVFGAKPEDPTILVWVRPYAVDQDASALQLSVFPPARLRMAFTRPSSGSSAAVAASPTTTSIRSEIDDIERSGRFAAMPQPVRVGNPRSLGNSSGDVTQDVENGTPYELRVLYSGPIDRDLTVQPGMKGRIVLPPGGYRVAAKVSNPNVLPYYGVQSYEAGSYSSRFFIRPQ